MHPLEVLHENELKQVSTALGAYLVSRQQTIPGHRSGKPRPGGGSEFLDYRDYVPGDDPRSIDWRCSARNRTPQLRRYVSEVSADWYILLDDSASMGIGAGAKWGRAIQLTAALAYMLLQQDHRVSVMLFSGQLDHRLPLGRGYAHYARVLQILRRQWPPSRGGDSRPSSCLKYLRRNCPVVLISDFLRADGMQEDLHAISQHAEQMHALQILSREELNPPRRDRLRVYDVEHGEAIDAAPRDATIRQLRQAVQEYLEAIRSHCDARRIRYSRHWTDRNWRDMLRDHLQPVPS